jgi:hypothetical protein
LFWEGCALAAGRTVRIEIALSAMINSAVA